MIFLCGLKLFDFWVKILPILKNGGNNMKERNASLTVILIIVIVVIVVFTGMKISEANMADYKKVDSNAVQVIADILNVRIGPGINYSIVSKVFQGDILRVYADINGWYLVQTLDNYFGLIRSDFVKSYKGKIPLENNVKTNKSELIEKQLLSLINEQRKKSGLKSLILDENLKRIARLKAQDMVNGNYFSHTSKKYGSPFEMLNNNKVKYKTAGENIAGSADVQQTIKAWMKTDSHKKNILNKNYNYTGIGIATSKDYGLIIVEEFVGR